MARLLLLADSNFENNYGKFKGPKIAHLEFKSCQSRKVVMQELDKIDSGVIVVSCLDMIVADVAKSNPTDADGAIDVHLNQLLYKLMDCVDQADGKLHIGVMAPIFWSSHSVPAKRALNHFFKNLRLKSLENITASELLRDIHAGADGVHLTEMSAFKYIQRILDLFNLIGEKAGSVPAQLEGGTDAGTGAGSWADDQPTVPDKDAVVALGPPEDMEVTSPARTTSALSTSMLHPDFASALGPGSQISTNQRLFQLAHGPASGFDLTVPPPRLVSNSLPPQQGQSEWRTMDVNSSLARIERRVGALEAKSFFDDVMMAGLKEDQDTEANRAMMNRVTMAGVEISGLAGLTSDAERIALIKDSVASVIDLVKQEGHQFKVLFVRHLNWRKNQPTAVIEVKLENEQQATMLRADFVKKQKDKESTLPSKLNIVPVVRMATRVRVEILHSIANLIKRRDPSVIRAMCLQYIPKPVIKVVRKSMSGSESVQTMTFIEAVCWVKENELMRVVDLSKAYERAGSTFNRVLTQTFVLLTPSNYTTSV